MAPKIDILNRKKIIDDIAMLVERGANSEKGICFALDGKWGTGKSFVLDKFEEKISEILCEDTADNKYFVVHYNCWQYNYYEEPAVAIVSAMLNALENEVNIIDPKVKEVVKQALGGIASKFVENRIGVDVVGMIKDASEKTTSQDFDSLFNFTKTLELARKYLKEIAENKTVVIVVDEMDRCLPEYAIKVLERLHHLFEGINNIVVVISVDTEQLKHSIKTIYGSDIDIDNYLKKFVAFKVVLNAGEISSDIFKKYKSFFSMFKISTDADKEIINELFSVIWKGQDIRTQEQSMTQCEMVHKMVSYLKESDNMALLIYELIIARYQRDFNKNMGNITRINGGDFPNVRELIGDDAYSYLMTQNKNIGKTMTTTPEGKSMDIALILFYKVYRSTERLPYDYGNNRLLIDGQLFPAASEFRYLMDIIE